MILAGNIAAAGFNLTLDGTATGSSVQGAISAAASVTKNGIGAWTFSGPNTYAGGTTVNAGTLTVTGSGTLGSNTAPLVLNNSSTVNPITLNLATNIPVVIGSFTQNLASSAVARISNTGSAVSFLLTGPGSFPDVFSGTGAFNYSVPSGSALTLSGANSNSGGVSVSTGTLALGSPTALGTDSVTVPGNDDKTTVSSGTTLDLNGQANVNNVLKISGAGIGGNGALVNSSSTPASLATNGAISDLFRQPLPGPASSTTTVSITGGGGSGASATPLFGLSTASFTISSGTVGYSVAPTVTISGGGSPSRDRLRHRHPRAARAARSPA